jgi:tetratricopeptide (TPR) repeat protein
MRFRTPSMFVAACSIVVLASTVPVIAQTNRGQAIKLCLDDASEPRDRVRGCSWLIRSVRRNDPELGDYYFFRAFGYKALREFEKAEADIDRSMAWRGGWGQSMLRGDIRVGRGNLAGAIDDFTAAVEFVRGGSAGDEAARTNLVYTLFSRAVAMHAAGRLSSAAFDLDEVIELKPDFRLAWDLRARVRMALGDYVGAEQDRRAASAD